MALRGWSSSMSVGSNAPTGLINMLNSLPGASQTKPWARNLKCSLPNRATKEEFLGSPFCQDMFCSHCMNSQGNCWVCFFFFFFFSIGEAEASCSFKLTNAQEIGSCLWLLTLDAGVGTCLCTDGCLDKSCTTDYCKRKSRLSSEGRNILLSREKLPCFQHGKCVRRMTLEKKPRRQQHSNWEKQWRDRENDCKMCLSNPS